MKFRYQAMDTNGTPVAGDIEATTTEEALGKIRSAGHFPTKIRKDDPAVKKRFLSRMESLFSWASKTKVAQMPEPEVKQDSGTNKMLGEAINLLVQARPFVRNWENRSVISGVEDAKQPIREAIDDLYRRYQESQQKNHVET